MSLNTGNLIEVIEDVEKSIHLLTIAGVATGPEGHREEVIAPECRGQCHTVEAGPWWASPAGAGATGRAET